MLRPRWRSDLLDTLKSWARLLKRDIRAIYLAARDPRVPWYAKILAGLVAAYGLSPIDLIPDFIPVLGHLDDLIIIPLGIALVVRLIPAEIMAEHRASAALEATNRTSLAGATLIVATWTAGLTCMIWAAYHYWTP